MSDNQDKNTTPKLVNKRRLQQISPDDNSCNVNINKRTCNMNRAGKISDHTMGDLIDEISRAVQSQVSQLVAQLATKDDLAQMNEQITELKRENLELRKTVASLTAKEGELRRTLVHLELQNRRNNLIFKGVDKPDNVQTSVAIKELCKEVFGMDKHPEIANIRTLALGNSTKTSYLVEFSSTDAVQSILKNAKKLKGSNVFIQRDYPLAIRKKRRALFKVKYELTRLGEGKEIFVRDDKLVIDKEFFDYEDGIFLKNGSAATDRIRDLFSNKSAVADILLKVGGNILIDSPSFDLGQ